LSYVGLVLGATLTTGVKAQTTQLTPGESFDRQYQKTCITAGCHAPSADRTIPRHLPYLEGQCLACHVDHATTGPLVGPLLASRSDAMCLACHTKFETTIVLPGTAPTSVSLGLEPAPAAGQGAGAAHVTHPPGGKACLECHVPHESRLRNLTRTPDDLLACAQCHQDFLEASAKLPHRHSYLDFRSQCGQCHSAHTNPRNHFLLPNVSESCLTCHDLPIRAGDRTLENVAIRMRNARYIHGAMREGSCASCHTPHGSTQPSLLRAGYPEGNYESFQPERYALCWQCHDAALATSVGGAGVTRFRNGEANLHRVHVVQLKRGRACHLCHEAHASDRPYLMRSLVTFGRWSAPIVYESTPEGGSCQTPCHESKTYRR
jgi:predicted CXXCH cytochrome family protein